MNERGGGQCARAGCWRGRLDKRRPHARTLSDAADEARPFRTTTPLPTERRDARRLSLRMLTWWLLIAAVSLSNAFFSSSVYAKEGWQQPGCHRVHHTRQVKIPGCVQFNMSTSSCRGYCESFAVPSGPMSNPGQPVTSVGQCCNIMEDKTVEARVLCSGRNGEMEMRILQFKSAVTCSCYHCKKD